MFDSYESANHEANKFNELHPVGTKVTYLKSQIEGKTFTVVTSAAKVYDSYPNGKPEFFVMVGLEHIGLALTSKTEKILG
ncbi:hypothetical protein J4N45_11110 [Vibrio sp. SCSIO 43140]|uniref:hypothetical protein n=1 Tax=Vibrio sp. SCSIO 43140 TaxID=2819100 RepID=UPI0020756D33|nr:hypothetical protein [Vibrio sp. SCSIO 43140]USD59080.1 hypothetical protein J4N45_11110 [Vibrio sp. SCSIO 43140]